MMHEYVVVVWFEPKDKAYEIFYKWLWDNGIDKNTLQDDDVRVDIFRSTENIVMARIGIKHNVIFREKIIIGEIVCENCGNEAVYRILGLCQGCFCIKCDWNVVTTYLPKNLIDDTNYEIYIVNADFKNIRHIKAYAKAKGVNFITSRAQILAGETVLFSGQAMEVLKIKQMLEAQGVFHSIVPKFPYCELGNFGIIAEE
jgi:hypothetical protein